MARGMPSLAALLGLVAVAGYQNRDKIGDFIRGLQRGKVEFIRAAQPERYDHLDSQAVHHQKAPHLIRSGAS